MKMDLPRSISWISSLLILISGTLPVWADPGVVIMPPPDTPELMLPVDQDTILVSELPVILDWSDVADIGTYEAQIYFSEPVEGQEPIPFKSKVLIGSQFEIPTQELLDLIAANDDSTFHWRVRAVNDEGTSDWTEVWEFTISGVNQPPTFNTGDPNFPVDGTETDELETLEFSVTASDPEGGALTYTIDPDSEAAGMMLDPVTGAFTWVPTEEQGPGSFMVTFTATDDGSPTASVDTTITLIVNEVNLAPELTVPDIVTSRPDTLVSFTATATDEDIPANELVFSLSGGETGMDIDPLTGEFTWTPADSGQFVVTVIVTDNGDPALSDSAAVTIQVTGNVPPTFNTGDPNFPVDGTEIDELDTLEFSLTATDPDGGVVSYAIDPDSEAAGMMLDPVTGAFTWVPTEEQGPGSFEVTFTATDDGDPAASVDTTITLIVNEVNLAPVLTVNPNATTQPNEEVAFTATATDDDIPANDLAFSLSGGEAGMAIDPTTGEFTWTAGSAGQFIVTVVVTDNGVPALSDSAAVTIQVTSNEPPLFDTNNLDFPADGTEIDELTALEFSVTATDPEGGVVTYAIDADSETAGMQFDPATGVFSWLPTEAQGPDSYQLTFTATDDGNPAASRDTTITVIVNEVNMAPVLDSLATQVANTGESVGFTATASDGDIPENNLTYSLSGEQPGMAIDPISGVFTWVMPEGGPFEVTVIVNDNSMIMPLTDSQVVSIVPEPTAPQVVSSAFCSTESTSLLEWAAVPADGYFIELDTDPNFSAPEVTLQTGQTSVEAPLGGLKVNTVYYWRVAAEIGGVRGPSSSSIPFRRWPATIQLGNTLAFPKATESSDFRMVSVPGQSNGISVASTFPGQTPLEDWRVYTDDAEAVAYPIYLQQVDSDAGTGELFFRPGRGFWALSTSAWEVAAQDLPSVTLDAQSSQFFEIPLFQGNSAGDARWTMIGNPFDFPVRWEDIVNANPITGDDVLWDWTSNGYVAATVMQPYKGYYFFNRDNNPTLQMPCYLEPANGTTTEAAEDDSPLVLTLRSVDEKGNESNSSIAIGWHDEAEDQLDARDRFMPPAFFESYRVTLVNEALGTEYPYLDREFRPAVNESQTFELELKSVPGARSTFEIQGIDNLDHAEIFLFDLAEGRSYDLRDNPKVSVEPEVEFSRYKLALGDAAFIADQESKLIPEVFTLKQSFPNPFVDQTTVEFSMPEQKYVELDVYNVLGQRVRTLISGEKEVGFHRVVWDGTNDVGDPVASGIYMYVFRTDSFQKTQKLVRVR